MPKLWRGTCRYIATLLKCPQVQPLVTQTRRGTGEVPLQSLFLHPMTNLATHTLQYCARSLVMNKVAQIFVRLTLYNSLISANHPKYQTQRGRPVCLPLLLLQPCMICEVLNISFDCTNHHPCILATLGLQACIQFYIIQNIYTV